MRRKVLGNFDESHDAQLITMVQKFMEFVQSLPRRERIKVLDALESSLQSARENLYPNGEIDD